VFVVEGLDLLSPVVSSPSIFVRGAGGDVESPYNTLVALDLKREGYRLWEVGGPDSEVPELAEAFFLGSPLVLSGHLYILAEIKNGVRLVALDPKTGKLLWSQHLVDLERNIDNDPFRRLAGATPSHADGVLVCPISAGVAIAVDLTSRTLLWAYSYEQSFSQNANQMRLMMMRGYPVSQTRKNDRWADGSVTIAKGRVLLTPIESEELHCVNLVSGNLLWKEGRDEGLYIGCVHNDRVIIVQREEVISRDLADGDEQWSLSLPGDSMPSGRGFYSEHFYYLPLTSAEVIKIDLNTGKIVDRSKSRDGSVPGNIICHRGRVLSQNAERLELFFQVETLRAQVEQGIQANPDDAASLTGLAELDLEDGDLDAAIKHLRRSYELVEDVRTRDLLVRCLLDGLRKNFSKYRTAESELESLVVQPDRQIAFLRLMADGHMKAGETIEAFDRYLELARLSNQELEEVATGHEVRSDRWVRSRIVRVLNQASPEARQQMEKQVKQLAAEAIAADSSNELRRFLNHFGEHPTARNVQRELALRLMEIEGAELECELLLFRLAKSEAKAQRAEATALLARHLTENARPADAAKLVERLRDQFADVECLEGKSGNEIAALLAGQLPKSDSAGGAYSYGEVRVKQDSLDTEDRRKLTRTFPLEFRAQRGPFFNDVAIVYDQNQQSVIARDGYGRDLYRVPVNNGNHNSRIFRYVNPNYNLSLAASRGHLLVMSLGTRIVAANTLSDSGMGNRKVLWDAELTEEIPGRTNSFGVRQRSVEVPGRFRRYEATDENNNPVGGLGPVLSTGVYYQSLGDVICVDPLSGETLWIRHDLPQGSTLIGDEEHLIVVPRSGKARVLDPADGSDLALRTAPSESKRMASFGAKVLTHDSSGGKIKLALRDLWEETDLWQHEFNLGAKMWIVDEEAVGIMEPSGHFVLLSLPDGETIIDEKLAAERSLSEIYVLQSSDQFLLITSQPVSEADPDRSFSAAPGGFSDPMINGRIYAFSKASGKPVWATPASVEQMGLLLPQPAELPVLTFVSHVSEKTSGRSRRTVTAVMCLDRRTGRVVFEKEDFPFGTGSYHVEGDPDKDSVELILPGKAVRMTWTGIPVPPEPTEQANLETPEPASGGFFRILGKILGN